MRKILGHQMPQLIRPGVDWDISQEHGLPLSPGGKPSKLGQK